MQAVKTGVGTRVMQLRAVARGFYIDRFRLKDPPIIIGGCARSGTTLLQAILSAHPRLLSIREETRAFCGDSYAADERPTHGSRVTLRDQARLYYYLGLEMVTAAHARWCEKTPHNVLRIERILDHFDSGVRIVLIVRDGRDVVLSRHPKRPDRAHVTPERWVRDVTAGLSYEDHPNVVTVRYEDLVLRFNCTIEQVLTRLHEQPRTELQEWERHATLRYSTAWHGPLQSLYGTSIGRWKQKGRDHDAVDQLMKSREAQALLRHYGYLH